MNFKIHLFDQIGINQTIIEEAAKAIENGFEYHSPLPHNKLIEILNELQHDYLVTFINIDDYHYFKLLIPNNLKVILIAAYCSNITKDSFFKTNEIHDYLEMPITSTQLVCLFRRIQIHIKQSNELKRLNDIGIALSSEKDIDNLLEMILSSCMDIAVADAASLYIVEEIQEIEFDKNNYLHNKRLRFAHAKNHSRKVPFEEFTVPINSTSLVGYTAMFGQPLRLDDTYQLPTDAPYKFNHSFDLSINYRTKSMLVVPMLNRDGETIGVIQLINKKRHPNIILSSKAETLKEAIPFTEQDENLILSLASQAAVAYENRTLYNNIQAAFNGFIKASVTAIEARDPTTSGHSERVAQLTLKLAETADHLNTGPFKEVQFSHRDFKEIEYASLLHDFGKIGVREPVLVKAKKLYDHELNQIRDRYTLIRKAIELKYTRDKLNHLLENSTQNASQLLSSIDQECVLKLSELDDFWNFILKANEPTVLHSEGFERLKEIEAKTFVFEEDIYQYLTEYEAKRLSISKGSLDNEERLEIESHVVHTYNFLRQIPWTNDLRNVPKIAYAHHEKLDGTGYPNKLEDEKIPIQSKMMAVSDIFDALTARDRPYKKAVPVERALNILGDEVKSNKLDKNLYDLFIEAKIYELTTGVGL
jgi:HD-GYP domain-containing protein (c-di-GMP phosphodiesterase class II)